MKSCEKTSRILAWAPSTETCPFSGTKGWSVSVGTVDGQERYDGNTSEHTHFICLDCGAVIDVDAEIDPALADAVEREYDLDVYSKQLTLYGKCVVCRAK